LPPLGDLLGFRAHALEHAHDVAFLHDNQFFTVDLDLGARPLTEQYAVARLEVERLGSVGLALFFSRRKGLVDIVVANENLH